MNCKWCYRSLIFASLMAPLNATAEPVSGWRGNQTGLWPNASPPIEWHRKPVGALEGLRASATRPKDDKPGDAPLVEKGLIRDWLVVGPFAVEDSGHA
jgi:hypothetical protein